jgi:hypothetical protein
MPLTFLLIALVAGLPPPGGTLFHTDKSPSGEIVAEHYIFQPSDPRKESPLRQIWLSYTKSDSPAALLFEHRRAAKVVFSPNDKWIAIDDFFGSGSADVRIFGRISGLKYEEVENAEVTSKCWALVDRIHGKSVAKALDHHYIETVRWAPDSGALLLKAWGYVSGEPLEVNDWLCIFDVERQEASTDLRLMNLGAVVDKRAP